MQAAGGRPVVVLERGMLPRPSTLVKARSVVCTKAGSRDGRGPTAAGPFFSGGCWLLTQRAVNSPEAGQG